jgi:PDZ domain
VSEPENSFGQEEDEDVPMLDRVRRGVVGLAVSFQDYDADRPWVKRSPATRYAQAVVVDGADGPLLLTTAQMVAGATMVAVEREGRPPRSAARVVHQDRELNLALLAVDEPGFFDALLPLRLASVSPSAGTLHSVRWSNQQFESAAVRIKRPGVSEVWFGRLRHVFLLARSGLADGGWAEPVVAGEELVGVVSAQDDHTAWVVPIEIIAAYLSQARDPASYVGFAVLRCSWQWTTDRAIAAWLGLGERPRGVMIRGIPRGSTGHGVLQPRDVLLSLDGHAIDSRGYYVHPRYGSVELTHIVVEGHRAGDRIPAQVLRGGQLVDLTIELRSYSNAMDLLPLRRGNEPPPYAIAGGLVFLELDGDYVRTWGSECWNRAPTRLVAPFYLEEGAQTPERRRIIILAQVLPSAWSMGYQDCRELLVRTIDGREIDSIHDVVEAFAHPAGRFVKVEFYPNDERAELVVDAETLPEATARILEDYGIPAAYRLPERPLPPLE